MLPYRDRGHLTTVYAASLSDELTKALGPVIGGIVAGVSDATRRCDVPNVGDYRSMLGDVALDLPCPFCGNPDVRRAGAQPLSLVPLHRAVL